MDVLVSATAPAPPPSTALTAPFVDADDVRSRFFFRRAYTGCYALTALRPSRSPVDLRLITSPSARARRRAFAEELLLKVAHAYEQATHTVAHQTRSWYRGRG